MNTIAPFSHFRLCPLHVGSDLVTHYVCHTNEKCCKQGCCVDFNNSLKYIQSWYFWLMVLLVFIIIYSCTWYWKKAKMTHRPTNIELANHSSNSSSISSAQTSPRRNDEVDHFLNCLLHTFNNRRSHQEGHKRTAPPPNYHVALNMPKCHKSTRNALIRFDDEVNNVRRGENSSENQLPPTYDDAVVPKREANKE